MNAGGRLAFFAFLWLLLTGADPNSWIFGGAAVAAATVASALLPPSPSWRWRAGGALRFIPFFLLHSIRGSLDVSRRALHPRLPLAPSFAPYRLRLPPGTSRVFLANTINLLPGTLSAEVEGDLLTVHLLDASPANLAELRTVEKRVADLFGVALVGGEGDDA